MTTGLVRYVKCRRRRLFAARKFISIVFLFPLYVYLTRIGNLGAFKLPFSYDFGDTDLTVLYRRNPVRVNRATTA